MKDPAMQLLHLLAIVLTAEVVAFAGGATGVGIPAGLPGLQSLAMMAIHMASLELDSSASIKVRYLLIFGNSCKGLLFSHHPIFWEKNIVISISPKIF
ncbi:hypothetical protein KFK09_011929 [Dendrobium nobile]|uniref:Uncharacterized protein n=1 Tax=Dendrobium nobile TaxID=94219 RepID=A0A8T3BFY1_DENNO|nr:hypothetical protein KFK09_011929 [Dendrobium nobile]